MERDLLEVLASQRKMLERRGKPARAEDDLMFLNVYTKHLDNVKHWLSLKVNADVIYISYKDLLEDPKRYAEELVRFTEIPLDVQKMTDIPKEKFYRQRSS